MSEPSKHAVVVQTETGAVPYALRSPIAALLRTEQARAVVAPLLRGADYDTVIAEVYRAAVDKPQILKCTPQSIVMAVADAVQTGLMIGRTIFLVPLTDKKSGLLKLNAWTGYIGDIELVTASGAARLVDAHCIYQADKFKHYEGTDPRIEHEPAFKKDRGSMIGAYAVAWMTGTLRKQAVLALDEIDRVRASSKEWNPSKYPICPDWWARKRAIKVVLKELPRNPRLAAVLARLDRQDELEFDEASVLGENGENARATQRATATVVSSRQAVAAALGSGPAAPVPEAPLDESSMFPESLDEMFPEETAPPVARRFTVSEQSTMPFTMADATVGTPLHLVPTGDLVVARNWAMQNAKFGAFVESAGIVLDDRRVAAKDGPR